MKNELKSNIIMFYIGVIFIIAAAILLLGNFMTENTFPIILGILGILFMGASRYRPLKK